MDHFEMGYSIYELYHHGVKGMKWGVRRYQNADGSLTAAGKARYKTGSYGVVNRGLRALTSHSTVYQKAAVGLNSGYRKDKKALTKGYEKQLSSAKTARDKEKIRAEYKQNKRELAIDVADQIYGHQSHELNERIQSQSWGKTFVKNALLGGSATAYDLMRSRGNGRLISAGAQFVATALAVSTGALSNIAYGVYATEERKR